MVWLEIFFFIFVIGITEKKLIKQSTISKSRKIRKREVRKGSSHFHTGFSEFQGLEAIKLVLMFFFF